MNIPSHIQNHQSSRSCSLIFLQLFNKSIALMQLPWVTTNKRMNLIKIQEFVELAGSPLISSFLNLTCILTGYPKR
jgi:hypothetical protein